MAKKKSVVVVGSINMDLVTNAERIPVEGETVTGRAFHMHPGGKGANQAVAVARLGHPVAMIGRLGNDDLAAQLRAHLQEAGVDTTRVATSQCSSGVAVIMVSDEGENCIVITPGANSLLTPGDLDANLDVLKAAGVVLTQLEIPMDTVEHLAQICTRENVPLILDPAPAKELPPGLLKSVAWFTPNETEASFFLTDIATRQGDPASIAETLMAKGPKGVVLKLGSRGAYLASETGLREQFDSFPVQAVDTTAAGDAFNGAFATGLLLGKGPVESARFAAAAAALSVTKAGAQPSMPRIAEVEQLLAEAGARVLQQGSKN